MPNPPLTSIYLLKKVVLSYFSINYDILILLGVPSSNRDMYHAHLVGAITPPVQHGGI